MALFGSILSLMAFYIFNINSQVLIPGPCPAHSVVQNFSTDSYLGTWYEIEKTFANFEVNGTCIQAVYSDFGNGTLRVYNSRIIAQTGEPSGTEGSARLEDPSKNEGKLLVHFPEMGSREGKYWILDTDYTSYSIVWSCRPVQGNLASLQILWFLSRTRSTTEFTKGFVHGYLKAIKFDASLLEETIQTNCPETRNLID